MDLLLDVHEEIVVRVLQKIDDFEDQRINFAPQENRTGFEAGNFHKLPQMEGQKKAAPVSRSGFFDSYQIKTR